MPKKTRDQFKEAFKAIKKPGRPKDVGKKDKSNVESLIDKATDFDANPDFIKAAQDLYDQAPDYMVDLIAYKYAKHFDENSEKLPFWIQQVPQEAFEKAIKKVAPNDMSDPLSQAALEVSVKGKGKQDRVGEIMFARDPNGMAEFTVEKWIAANKVGDKEMLGKWGRLLPTAGAEFAVKAAVGSGDTAAAFAFGERLSLLTKKKMVDVQTKVEEDDGMGGKRTVSKTEKKTVDAIDHDLILEVAKVNPANFTANMLRGLKSKNEFVEIVSNPALQSYLAEKAPDEWAELVKATPCLALVKNVQKAIVDNKLKTDAKKVEAMFDSIVKNEGIPLAYATNSLFPNPAILSGNTEVLETTQKRLKDVMKEAAPDLPATQCHSLLHLVEDMMNICPGLTKKPTITQGTCTKMLLTAPLSGIPGQGLLDKGFGGNVFDEAGGPADQILFTGDAGINSHTWLVIDGVPYDPVLGTRGNEVAASIDDEYTWLILDRVARGSKAVDPGGKIAYIIKGQREDGKKTPNAGSNKMGFSTGYLKTTQPAKFLTEDELKQAKIPTEKDTVTETM